jgi:hypothetical protein
VHETLSQGQQAIRAAGPGLESEDNRVQSPEKGKGSHKEGIVTAGDEKELLRHLEEGELLGHVDDRRFQPTIHQVDGEEPFSGDLRRRQTAVVDEGVDLLFVNTQIRGDLLGIQ